MSDQLKDDLQDSLTALERAALLLGQSDEDEALLYAVVDGVVALTGAGRVAMLAGGPGIHELRPLIVRDAAGDPAAGRFTAGEPLVERVLSSGEASFEPDVAGDVAAIAVPLVNAGRILGVIYATEIAAGLAEVDLQALQALANQAGAALQRANLDASLLALEKAQREFVSLTTHQLRVPLTSISGYTDLLLSGIAGSLSDRQEHFLLTVRRNADRMGLLIGDLGDLNRIRDQRMPLKVAAFDMGKLIDEVIQEQALAIAGRSHELKLLLPADLPLAYGDGGEIKRAFSRILTNAIQYTAEGGTVTISAAREGDMLQVTVTDTGIGISPEDQAELFKPFFRSEAEAVREHAGWGLSLALAKALLEVQDGGLWCESQAGVGSAFHVTIPVAGTERERPAS